MPILRQETGQGAGRKFKLGVKPVVFGRAPECKIPLDDRRASRQHARLSLEGGEYVLEDLQSSNGTRVNGGKIARVTLRNGDIFSIGGASFRYVVEETTKPTERIPVVTEAEAAAGPEAPAPPPPEPPLPAPEPPVPETALPLPETALPLQATAAPVSATAPPVPVPAPAPPVPAPARPPARALWKPTLDQVGRARITQFMARVAGPHGDPFTRFEGLHDWSVREPESFWSAVWEFGEVRGERGARVLADADEMPGARWFPDAALNFAENLLRRGDAAPALVSRREDGRRQVVSFAALRAEVARLQAALRSAGIRPGDRVAAWLPNAPEAVVAFLASASLGAPWVACAPDLDGAGLAARLRPLEPRLLFASDGWLLGGRWSDRLAPLREAAAALPSLERVVVLPWASSSPDLSGLRGGADWRPFSMGSTGPTGEPTFERFPFAHPLAILFPPPGTGPAESGVVHGAGGALLQVLCEHQLHADLRAGDSVLFLATTDEAAWPWTVAALASGATVALHDGHPLRPGPAALLDAARDEGITMLGVPSLYLDVIERAQVAPAARGGLPRLRAILASGAPLAGGLYDYVHEKLAPDVPLVPLLGGPELLTHFGLGAPILPVRRGEIPCRALGLRVEVADGSGRAVTGEPGDLVCRGPFPGMPLGFCGDPDGSRFRAAYFERFPGAWHCGERGTLAEDGSLVA